jgi:hypothetical protein
MDLGKTTIDTDISIGNILGSPYNVILFNDNDHSFDEVVAQVMNSVKCGAAKAQQITMEAHTTGQSIAFSGNRERCEHVDSLLAGPPCRLTTDIQPA